MNSELIQKYNIPGPRYTSYPTVPFWDETGIPISTWKDSVVRSFNESNASEGISLYIHLPFCENLCTFCACHKRITKRHSVEIPYIDTVLKEWKLYVDLFNKTPRINDIHLGGGTPTFFSSENLERLINGIFQFADKTSNFQLSYEGHPNHTSIEQLQTLYNLGSRRNSFGVQDYDPKVQKAINRIQGYEQVEKVHKESQEIGYQSISHDLVFGLPFQTADSIKHTISKTIELKPDRIAYYSYAHVPWIKGVGQRGFDENDLPKDDEKRHLYELGKQLLFDNGYEEIGMDHFALPTDSLYLAMENKELHRNFMGYTEGKTHLMIGLGMSSISDSWYAFAQNDKSVESYTKIVNSGEIPIFRGHNLTNEDLIIRKHILNLMCQLETHWNLGLSIDKRSEIILRLNEFLADDLLELIDNGIKVKEQGRMFIRNICMAFDLRLLAKKSNTRLFSMTI